MHNTPMAPAKRRDEMYDFICSFSEEHGYSPSVRDIARELGIRSTSTVFFDLRELEKEGLIKMDNKKSRTIVINQNNVSYLDAKKAAETIAAFCDGRTCPDCPALKLNTFNTICKLKEAAFKEKIY